jgi:hypothetical protein
MRRAGLDFDEGFATPPPVPAHCNAGDESLPFAVHALQRRLRILPHRLAAPAEPGFALRGWKGRRPLVVSAAASVTPCAAAAGTPAAVDADASAAAAVRGFLRKLTLASHVSRCC